jgi:signal peptidase I
VLLYIFIAALIVKSFFVDAYRIPTASMENTLLKGDNLIVSKMSYNFSTPGRIPILDKKIPYVNIFEIGKPEINDLIIFDFPAVKLFDGSVIEEKFVKRIIAGPGDTLLINGKKFFVNNKEIKLPGSIKYSKYDIKKRSEPDEGIFPTGKKWNRDFYGPIVIPKKGDTILITPKNFREWQNTVVLDHGAKELREEGTVITLDDKPIQNYVIEHDHYFVIGDNLDVSRDSRYFGFVNDKMIIGKVLFIYWSMDPSKIADGPLGFLSGIRSNRMFRTVN